MNRLPASIVERANLFLAEESGGQFRLLPKMVCRLVEAALAFDGHTFLALLSLGSTSPPSGPYSSPSRPQRAVATDACKAFCKSLAFDYGNSPASAKIHWSANTGLPPTCQPIFLGTRIVR